MGRKTVHYGAMTKEISREIYDSIKNKISRLEYEDAFIILPNGRIINEYRERLLEDIGYLTPVNLVTFDDIVNIILKDFKLGPIDEGLKFIILKDTLNELDLKYYEKVKNMDGFILNIANILSDIKRSLIRPEDYRARCPEALDFKEIGEIYFKYECNLEKLGLIDREGLYLKAIERLEEDQSISKMKIVIDQFFDFRPIEYRILEAFAKRDMDISINIPFKSHRTSQVLDETLEHLEGIGFEIIEEELLEEENFIGLASSLFSRPRLGIDRSSIGIFSGVNKKIEVEHLFKIIKEDYSKGLAFSEMAVIYGDSSYLGYIYERAEKEGIPIVTDRRKPLIEDQFIAETLSILKSHIDNRPDSSFRLISKYFLGPEARQNKDKIYLNLRSQNYSSLEELRANFKENPGVEELLEDINYEKTLLEKASSIRDFNNFIIEIFRRYKLEEDLLNNLESLNRLKSLDRALSKIASYDENFQKIDLKTYYILLQEAIRSEEILVKRGEVKGLNLYDPNSFRGFSYKNIFVLGMAEGTYPNIGRDNFFFSEDNYSKLRELGLDIKDYDYRFDNELIKLSNIISSTENKLYLSYSRGDTDIRSLFLEEIIRVSNFSEDQIVNLDYDYVLKENRDLVTNREDLKIHNLNGYYKKSMDFLYRGLREEFLDLIPKMELLESRYANRIDDYNGQIEDQWVLDKIGSDLRERKLSSSYLESYLACPYNFFAERILGLKDIYELETIDDPLKIGNIYHEFLENFHKKYDNRIFKEGLVSFREEIYMDFLNLAEDHGYDLDRKDHLFLIESLYENIWAYLQVDLDFLYKNKLEPVEFEKYFEYELEEGDRKIIIRGYIDRIDRLPDGNLLVLDYKTSREIKPGEIVEGRSLQLPIYIMGQGEKVVAGLYGVIKSREIKQGIEKAAYGLINKKQGMKSEEEWASILESSRNLIFDIVDDIELGKFIRDESNCPVWCKFKDICGR